LRGHVNRNFLAKDEIHLDSFQTVYRWQKQLYGCRSSAVTWLRCLDEVKSGDDGRLNNLHTVSASAREWKANFQHPPTTITLWPPRRPTPLLYSRTMLYYNIRVHCTFDVGILLSVLHCWSNSADSFLYAHAQYICINRYSTWRQRRCCVLISLARKTLHILYLIPYFVGIY